MKTGRRLGLPLLAALALALSPLHSEASGGYPDASTLLVIGLTLTSPVPIIGFGVVTAARWNAEPSFGWGLFQSLVTVPYAAGGLALAAMLSYDTLKFGLQAEEIPVLVIANALGLTIAGLNGWYAFRGIRELVRSRQPTPASQATAQWYLLPMVGRHGTLGGVAALTF
jgi:hypothetical protein